MKTPVALLVLSVLASAHAQQAAPEGPLLNPPPDSTKWTVTTTTTVSAAPGSASPREAKPLEIKTAGEKAGDLAHTKTVANDGVTIETLTKGSTRAISNSAWSEPRISAVPEQFYEGLEWVAAGTFKGTKNEGGRQLLVFENVLDGGGGGGADLRPDIHLSAIVDAHTRLPVQSKSESVPFGENKISIYEFHPMQAGEAVAVPANLAALLKTAEAAQEQSAVTSERP